MYAESQIYAKQKEVNYPTSDDIKIKEPRQEYYPPDWQVDYNKYGNIRGYQKTVRKFWQEANRYLYEPNTSNILFRFYPKPEDLVLFNQFREDLGKKLDLPAKYDIYKN